MSHWLMGGRGPHAVRAGGTRHPGGGTRRPGGGRFGIPRATEGFAAGSAARGGGVQAGTALPRRCISPPAARPLLAGRGEPQGRQLVKLHGPAVALHSTAQQQSSMSSARPPDRKALQDGSPPPTAFHPSPPPAGFCPELLMYKEAGAEPPPPPPFLSPASLAKLLASWRATSYYPAPRPPPQKPLHHSQSSWPAG
jgi:hypothetical protein